MSDVLKWIGIFMVAALIFLAVSYGLISLSLTIRDAYIVASIFTFIIGCISGIASFLSSVAAVYTILWGPPQ